MPPLFDLADLLPVSFDTARVPVIRQPLKIAPDPTRVITIPLNYGADAVRERVERALEVSEDDALVWLARTAAQFNGRHRNLTGALRARWRDLAAGLEIDGTHISPTRQLLVAAYLTMEYSVGAAALCNPSIVAHPDQTGAAPGELRVVISLRAVGEGHRSSIEFRSGTVRPDGTLELDAPRGHAEVGTFTPNGPDSYFVGFDPATSLDERVLFAAAVDESLGLEDARLVRLTGPDGTPTIAATYSAYDGRVVTVKLLRTDDFRTFRVDKLTGPGARDKGIALFPRQIGGKWWAASRQDGQRMFVTTSDDLVDWADPVRIDEPRRGWELVQQGNCGSPIETDHGWLLITHGVGLMRRYVLGAVLLDLENPAIVVARLEVPLMEPTEDEREGYVPNVLYSCGGVAHNGRVVLPFAASDRSCSVASFEIADVVNAMVRAA